MITDTIHRKNISLGYALPKPTDSPAFVYAKYRNHYRVVSQAFYERNRHRGIVQVYSREIAVEPCQRFDFPPMPYCEMLARVEAMQAAFAGFKAGKMVKLAGAAD